jgi:hypothetical protein
VGDWKLFVMKSLLVRRLWFVGVLAGIILISGAVKIAASPGHSQVHLDVASSSAAPQQEERHDAKPEAAENENDEAEAPPTPTPMAPPAAPPVTSSRTFTLVGGTVTVTCTGNAISLDSVVPNAGFMIDKQEIQSVSNLGTDVKAGAL